MPTSCAEEHRDAAMELLPLLVSACVACAVFAEIHHDRIHWSYAEGGLEQTQWATKYPDCGGKKQSPIDIKRRNVRYNPDMLKLDLSGYDAQEGAFLVTNNGHTVQISLPPTMAIIKGLPYTYTAVQMHLHWGGWDLEASGSEHTVDGIRYMAELHIVHYNSDKYRSISEAKDKPDGLAVLAFFYDDGHFENTYYSDFINNLEKIKYTGQSTNISKINVRSMLPENLSNFYRYEGSLTTPPCYESIIWTVFDTPITLSHNQIRKLESTLMDINNKTLWDDYRIAQPLNDRVVESSFLPRLGKGTFCRQEEIESKLLRIEGLVTSLGKNLFSGGPSNSIPTEHSGVFPLVLSFPENNYYAYASASLISPLELNCFTVCMHVLLETEGVHTVFYSRNDKDDTNELSISIGGENNTREVGLWIGNEFINLPYSSQPRGWTIYCVAWSSDTGSVDLWINSTVGPHRSLKNGYKITLDGPFILGKNQDGFLGISSMDAFVGKMTDINMWDYVLTKADIRNQMACEVNSPMIGNVLSWDISKLNLYGGVQLHNNYRCP